MSEPAAVGPKGSGLGAGYKTYALVILVAVYTSNFIDRQIIGTLGQAIKVDLKLTDFQLGALSGIAFAILYSLIGVPIARIAERRNRTTIIAISIALWSGFTAACGLATSFMQLFLTRVGVGIGEAGCSPPAQSLISDYFSPRARSTALGIYSLGIPLGALFGALLGGKIAQLWGWRDAFFIVGLPGLILAIIIKLTLKEPPRGGYDAVVSEGPTPSLGDAFRKLLAAKSFPHLTAGATLGSLAGYGVSFFAVPFLLRGPFHLDIAQAGAVYGIGGGLAAAVGVFLGGAITDLIGRMSRTGYAVIPGLGFLACSPLYVWAFQQDDLATLGSFVIAPLILQYLYLGPTFALTHNLVEPRMRATATALLFLPINLIGLGVGPPLVGWLSDVIAQRHFTQAGSFKLLCPGGHAAKGAQAALASACHAASFDGVKWAIIVVSGVMFAWGGFHYLLAARTVKRDLVAATQS